MLLAVIVGERFQPSTGTVTGGLALVAIPASNGLSPMAAPFLCG